MISKSRFLKNLSEITIFPSATNYTKIVVLLLLKIMKIQKYYGVHVHFSNTYTNIDIDKFIS